MEQELTPNPEPKPKKRGKWKKRIVIVLCILLALLLLTMGGVVIYINYLMSLMQRPQDTMNTAGTVTGPTEELTLPPEETVGPEITDPTIEVTWPSETTPVVDNDRVINIMLLGEDNKAGYYRGRTDAMILVTINTKTKTITLTSIMRDLFVQIPGWADNRINAAYVFGGIDLFEQTFTENFGITLDGIIMVELEKFADVVDILGGVTMELTQKEADYLRIGMNWPHIHAGVNRLNGEEALCYSRLREIDNDFVRTNRQRKVIEAIINEYKQQPLDRLLPLMQQILPMLTITMTNAEMFEYAFEMFPLLSGATVNAIRLPVEGSYKGAIVSKMWVIVADMEANRKVLQDLQITD